MAKSGGFGRAEARALLKLSHAVHVELEPAARKRRLLDGLCDVLAASGAACVVSYVPHPRGCARVISTLGSGVWARDLPNDDHCPPDDCHTPMPHRRAHPVWRAAPIPRRIQQPAPAPSWVVARPDRTSYENMMQHCMACVVPADAGRVKACLQITRASRGRATRPFSHRDRGLLDSLHREMTWIYQADLILASPAARDLPAREHEALRHLLAGKSEKIIAEHMNVRYNTVHHYVKSLYRRLGVTSRSELLAGWTG